MASQKRPTFLGSVKFLLIGTLWTMGYLFLGLRLLWGGYVISAYMTMPFMSLGIVVAIIGVVRFRRFLRGLDEEKEQELNAEPEPV